MSVKQSTIAAIRFGYGFHPTETPPTGADDLIAQIRQGARSKLIFPVATASQRRALLDNFIAARKAKDRDERKKIVRQMRMSTARDASARVYQRALSPYGFYERLAAFWADHFTVSGRNPGQLYMIPAFETAAIRPYITGRFADMLTAVVQHPAMLIYLDQVENFGPASRAGKRTGRGLNENLAREVLELHTLGADGPYNQRDVRQLAELLTGYGVQRGYLSFRFVPNRAEPGPETILGKTYGGDPPRAAHARALLEDLARHPATATHLARKLATHFVSDQPDTDLIRHIAGAWTRSDGHLPRVYEALLSHPATWRDFGAKVKRPQELIASTLRASAITKRFAEGALKKPKRIIGALKALGQPLFRAPGPDGWPEEAEAWITPQGLAARITFASRAGILLARNPDTDPRIFAESALGDALRPDTAFAVGAAPDRWEGFAFAIASPEFNRR